MFAKRVFCPAGKVPRAASRRRKRGRRLVTERLNGLRQFLYIPEMGRLILERGKERAGELGHLLGALAGDREVAKSGHLKSAGGPRDTRHAHTARAK